MPKATLYTGSSGIINKARPERLPFDPKTGVAGLQQADNVFIDQTGAVSSIRYPKLIREGGYSSLLEDVHGYGYGFVLEHRPDVGDAAIMRVDVGDSGEAIFTGIRSGLDIGRKMSWDWAMSKGEHKVFYTNGEKFGTIDGYESLSWPEDLFQNEKTAVALVQLNDFFNETPPSHLCFNWGQVFFSFTGRDGAHQLGHSEYGGKYGLFQPGRNGIQFPDRITMLAPAYDGHYVGTETAIYFLTGQDTDSLTMKKVYRYPPIEHGLCRRPVDASFLGFEMPTETYITPTTKGPIALLPGGMVSNLIDKNVSMPGDCNKGSLAVFDESLIIQTHE